jgi:hypothetical protein
LAEQVDWVQALAFLGMALRHRAVVARLLQQTQTAVTALLAESSSLAGKE